MDSQELFVNTPTRRLFLMAAAPGALSMLASALYDSLDGIIVGRLLGETAFAAVNLAMPFVILVFAVGDLFGVGSSVPISISLGEGNREKANTIFTCSVVYIVGFGALFGTLFWVLAPTIMRLMGADGTLARTGVTFLRVYAACSPITSLMFAVDNFLRICGKIRESLYLNLTMALLGAVVEFSLVRFFHLGIFGAALGYCLALMFCSLAGMLPFARGRMLLKFVRPRFTGEGFREICAAGSPALLNNIAGRVTSVLLNSSLLHIGGEQAVAVYGLLMYIGGMVYPLIYGVCDSLQPAVGYNWGARRQDRVISLEKHIFLAAALVSGAMVAMMVLLPDQLTALFMGRSMDAPFLRMARRAFAFFAAANALKWLPMATMSFLMAIERPRPASMLSVASTLVFPVVALVALSPFGLDGLWLNSLMAGLCSCALSAWVLVRLRSELRGGR